MSRCRQMNKLYCEIIKIGESIGKKKKNPTMPPSPPTHSSLALALVTHGKSFQLEISIALSVYARELNIMSKCRQMNNLCCEISSRERYG